MISSLMDTWILVALAEEQRKRNRWLYVLKSRGMPHSNDVRGFAITDRGIDIAPLDSNGTGIKTRSASPVPRRIPAPKARKRK
jgi:circadian clock protein KaiC